MDSSDRHSLSTQLWDFQQTITNNDDDFTAQESHSDNNIPIVVKIDYVCTEIEEVDE